MDDTHKAGQDLLHGPGAGLAQNQVQVREPGFAVTKEDQNLKEDEQSACPMFNDVQFHELPCLQKLIEDDEDLPDHTAVEAAAAADAKVVEVALDEPLESKEDAMETDPPIGNEDNPSAPPISPDISLPSNAANQSAALVKNAWIDIEMAEGDESGTPEDRVEFMKEIENFHRERALEFKPPKFYGEPLNCLKLWRAVIRLGGYDVVTASKLWRQVGESFHPPKTCTTVSWTFRIFYEKALLEYEKHKRLTGELQLPVGSLPQSTNTEKETGYYQAPGSGRARRDAAARAMQGWHAQRLVGYGEDAEPIIKDKNLGSTSKREKNLKNIGFPKHKMLTNTDHVGRDADFESDKQVMTTVMDVGPPADWVKINVREMNDCFEVYALVPGLLREEVRVQSDPAGRLVITGQPEQVDNPWGITPFKKVVSLPTRIDPLQTSAVVSLHGRLFVRAPFEQGSM